MDDTWGGGAEAELGDSPPAGLPGKQPIWQAHARFAIGSDRQDACRVLPPPGAATPTS